MDWELIGWLKKKQQVSPAARGWRVGKLASLWGYKQRGLCDDFESATTFRLALHES